ncbi:hypothetical protein KVT40_007172 [Elsinoe batatas]|uniref:Uncharacterized protein n=1 Tax=Elsinoe batatas TaxID=2601811 RepID=A0A8K0KWK5_9PEZI|nr:hypothetical protein KVT40_007172 [Elsinoe batatas]
MSATDNEILHGLKELINARDWRDVVAVMYWRSVSGFSSICPWLTPVGKAEPSRTANIRSFFDARGTCLFCDRTFGYQKKIGEHVGKCKSIGNHYRRARAASTSDLPTTTHHPSFEVAQEASQVGPFCHGNADDQPLMISANLDINAIMQAGPLTRPLIRPTSWSASHVPTVGSLTFPAPSPEYQNLCSSSGPIRGHWHQLSTSTNSTQHRRMASDQTDEMPIGSYMNEAFVQPADPDYYEEQATATWDQSTSVDLDQAFESFEGGIQPWDVSYEPLP